MRIVKSFLQFLWDFFIGDTPELFVGACLVVGLGWFAHRVSPSITLISLPASVALVVAWSLRRFRGR
jgi:hypothetical protein